MDFLTPPCITRRVGTLARHLFVCLVLGSSAAIPAAEPPEALRPAVDITPLPALGPEWLATNPYRNNAEATAIGRQLFNSACAACHGPDGDNRQHVGPDLLRLHRGCRKLTDAPTKARCMADVDAYFVKSVRHGKSILDVTHMPAWEGVLNQESIWAIKRFLESRSAL